MSKGARIRSKRNEAKTLAKEERKLRLPRRQDFHLQGKFKSRSKYLANGQLIGEEYENVGEGDE